VKLLLDENLSVHVLARIADSFPGSTHVKRVGLLPATDQDTWDRARTQGYVLVTRDRDFEQLCALRGAPPKVVWLRVGNCSTQQVARLPHGNLTNLEAFVQAPEVALLILTEAGTGT